MDAYRSRRVVRITANYENAQAIASAIESVLSRVRRVDVDLPLLQSLLQDSRKKKQILSNLEKDVFDDSAIATVARLTDTVVARLPDSKVRLLGRRRRSSRGILTSRSLLSIV